MLQDVQAGEQRVVLISGEAGVGKSRLAEEPLRRRFDPRFSVIERRRAGRGWTNIRCVDRCFSAGKDGLIWWSGCPIH